ncbi:MAG: hypothetical protein R2705_24520 [Ilumatobacteraceae bacterium]
MYQRPVAVKSLSPSRTVPLSVVWIVRRYLAIDVRQSSTIASRPWTSRPPGSDQGAFTAHVDAQRLVGVDDGASQ